MRIVKRPEFLTLPPGTVFMSYEPCVYSGLSIKWETCGNDWFYTYLDGCVENHDSGEFAERSIAMDKHGARLSADFNWQQRDGCFGEASQIFAIYDPDDVSSLIEILVRANLRARGVS